ncbi:MAG: lasso peptide biosynthesis B2 protein [Nitrospira sp.]|nr:lasso peptide biosynthesis B2 protein [Nitrospira sp.]MDH4245831.1 lasso peptide biosynthesis B2 protein [Nitrospira sp.]MDH4355269.1 lasso peptide biosynthesis B2 protein [Nitrospira sp.]MDH5317497.1 lasso peptide biosynthesis B2 protein [Nitrospira sp.]
MRQIRFRLVHKYWTILWVGAAVLWIRIALRFKTLPRVLEQFGTLSAKAKQNDAEMKILTCYVDRWLRLFPYNKRGNCFPRSLALYRFARQLGYPVMFHCGVRKDMSGLDGHAWLTLNGQAFQEPGTHWQGFTVTFFYPPDGSKSVSQGSGIRCECFGTMEP